MGKGKILGLDIGTASLKLALCGDGRAPVCAAVDVPDGLMRAGRIAAPDTLADLVRGAIRQIGMRVRRAAVVLPREACLIQNLELPAMTGAQIRKSLPYEFATFISDSLNDYIFDYALLSAPGPEDRRMRILAAAIRDDYLGQLQDSLHRAGLKLVCAAPGESVFRSILRRSAVSSGQRGVCFVSLGHHATGMYIFRGTCHRATHMLLDANLHTLEEAIARNAGLDSISARGYLLENREDCLRWDCSMEVYRKITAELTRTLNYYPRRPAGGSLALRRRNGCRAAAGGNRGSGLCPGGRRRGPSCPGTAGRHGPG